MFNVAAELKVDRKAIRTAMHDNLTLNYTARQ